MADRMIVSGDFDEARRRAQIQKVLSTFRWKNPDLLSFYEVTKLIKPDAQFYKGMQTIPVKNIIVPRTATMTSPLPSTLSPTSYSTDGRA